jgi:hypothetical protein
VVVVAGKIKSNRPIVYRCIKNQKRFIPGNIKFSEKKKKKEIAINPIAVL